MGSVGDCYDNSMMESFWGTMQLELLDSRSWKTRAELANAIFEWIECWYNPKRRHSSIGMLSPVAYEVHHTAPTKITDPTPSVSGLRGQPHPAPPTRSRHPPQAPGPEPASHLSGDSAATGVIRGLAATAPAQDRAIDVGADALDNVGG